MKKVCLTLGAALVGLSGFASTRILYQQNFETVTSAEEAGWQFGGASMTIASDDFGKFLDLQLGQNNGRSGICTWGQDIFLNEAGESVLEDGIYTVVFDFNIKAVPNNQVGSGITLFTNHAPVTNQGYRLPWNPSGVWSNYVLSIEQTNATADAAADMTVGVNAPLKETANEDGSISYSIDNANEVSVATGTWYTATAIVDVNARKVEYSVVSVTGDILTDGETIIPEADANGDPISMYAEGLYVMMSRYQSNFLFDNIKISYESALAFANDPTVALTRLGQNEEGEEDLNLRAYTITFLDGETLHVTGTDGETVEVEYADCDGAYVYETSTSGNMTAWTTSEGATSEKIVTAIECTPLALPAAVASITSVEAGFGKIYTLTVDNADVPLRPTIFISYEFKGNDGTIFSDSELGSGAQVTVPGEGVLTITTEAFGYQATTISVDNDLEYVIKKEYDFARMSKEELAEAGFTSWQVLNSATTSGFSNWTARKYLYYNLAGTETVNEAGETVYETVYPFGFIAEDNTTNVIEYSEIMAENNTAESKHFDGIQVYVGHNLCALYRIGVYNNETGGGNNKNIYIPNLDATDVVVANKIGGYGGNSIHPVCATDDEYYAQLAGENFVYLPVEDTAKDEDGNEIKLGTYSVNVDVYRIDTVCSTLTIYAQKSAGVEEVGAEVENNDPWYYTIDGLRVAEPTRPGLYIHKGKKIIVK